MCEYLLATNATNNAISFEIFIINIINSELLNNQLFINLHNCKSCLECHYLKYKKVQVDISKIINVPIIYYELSVESPCSSFIYVSFFLQIGTHLTSISPKL